MLIHALSSRRLTVLLLFAVTAVTGAITYNGRVQGHGQPEYTNTMALLTTNRTGLQICVQSLIPGVNSQVAQGQVRGAMSSVSNHPDFQTSWLRGPASRG